MGAVTKLTQDVVGSGARRETAGGGCPWWLFLLYGSRLTNIGGKLLNFEHPGDWSAANRWFDYAFRGLGRISSGPAPGMRTIKTDFFSASIRPFATSIDTPTIQMNFPMASDVMIKIRFVGQIPFRGA